MSTLQSLASLLGLASALGLVVACSNSGSSSPDNQGGPSEAGSDAPTTDSPSSADAPHCSVDATATSCCCDGDVQEAPVCSAEGTLSCAMGYGLYQGADCSCTTGHGPCCGAQNTLDAPSDGDVCSAPKVLRYETAGCGASAHPLCGSSDQDACATPVCGCDGTTLVKCDYASAPWSRLGPCTPADASADAPEQ
jgi:hypothetical protein